MVGQALKRAMCPLLAISLCACAAAQPYAEAAPFEPSPLPEQTASATATPGWWTTAAAEQEEGLVLKALAPTSTPAPSGTPAPLPGATGAATSSPLSLPTAWPGGWELGESGLGLTLTPVAYDSLVGKIVYRSRRDGGYERFYVMNADGSDQHPLYSQEQDFLGDAGKALYERAVAAQAWSGDRSHQVYVRDAWGQAQLFILRAQDGATWQLTRQGAGLSYDPAWQPTGDRIAFACNESGNDEIWTVRSDGADARQLTHNSWEWDKFPSWSPDGGQIVFVSNREGRNQVYVMNADGTRQRNLSSSPYQDSDPVWVR